jgi:hypothetical protein
MNCILSSVAGLGLLGGSISTMLVSETELDKISGSFSPDVAEAYRSIVKERTLHYIQGILLGLVVSFFVVYSMKIAKRFHRIMLFFGVTLFTGLTYYTVMPKSDYMLNHLEKPEDIQAWLETYKTMKWRYIVGIVLGALAAIPIGNAYC